MSPGWRESGRVRKSGGTVGGSLPGVNLEGGVSKSIREGKSGRKGVWGLSLWIES